MTFRNQFIVIAKFVSMIAFGLQMTACSDFLKGKPKKEPYIEVKNESLSCLKDVSTKLKAVLKSETTEKEVDDSFACLDKVLSEFQVRAEGINDANSFSKDDLFQIFDKFLNDAKISNEATADILKLKAALVGGSELRINKIEISALKDFLIKIKAEVIKLIPYAKVFNFKRGNNEFSKVLIKDAFAQLSVSVMKVISESLVNRSDYRFEDLKKLVLNLKIISDDQTELIDLAEDVKDLLTGNELLKTENDYNVFIGSFTEMLRLYTLNQQGYIAFEISDSIKMNDAIEFIEGWISVLENSNQFKRTKVISAESFDPILLKIAKKDILPVQIAPETLVQFYKTLLVRVFESGPAGNLQLFTGITKIHFDNLKKEIALLKIYIAFVNTLNFPALSADNSNGGLDIKEIQSAIQKMDAKLISSILMKFDQQGQTQIINAFNEFKFEMLQARPVVYRYKKMVIAANQEIWKQNWSDLIYALYAKMMARELLIGWGDGIATSLVQNSVITESGLVKWYSEFKQFGVDVKLFDPRTDNAGAKSFKEANLFTYSGNGDDKINYLEAVQYLNILTSAGGKTFSELKKGFASAGCNMKERDIFDNPWNQDACVYENFKKNYKVYFNNLSYLSAYLATLTDQQFFNYYESVMSVARTDKANKGKRVETADIRNLSVLLHYIESLYAMYDVNKNWSLSAAEIRASYPRFTVFATDFAYKNAKDKLDLFNSVAVQALGYSCYSQADLIQESFIYLVFKGSTPGVSDLNIAPCIGQRSLIDFTGEVNRSNIINTFKILKDVIGS
ncbi:MAG: hypothetical protein WA160_15485 [Pseudobdellovibrio sp.]